VQRVLNQSPSSEKLIEQIFLPTVAAPPVLGHVSPSFLVHKDGDTVELFCDATATPEPLVTWRKDNREMTSSARVRVTPTRVEIRDVDRMDGGAYTCTFRNVVGHVSHTIKLVIEGQS